MAKRTRVPNFEGEPLFESPEFQPLIYNPYGIELVKRVNSEFKGTLAGFPAYNSKKQNKPILGSNIFRLFAIDKVARKLKQGDSLGARVMYPKEAEFLLATNRLPEQGQTYFDLGLVLDFSRANHDLAIDIYQQIPEKNLDTLPAVLLGLEPKKSDKEVCGLSFVYGANSQFRHSPILAEKTGFFKLDDLELFRTGLPSELGEGTRRLWTTEQYSLSEDNLGLRRLYLDPDSDLLAVHDLLGDFAAHDRVVLISAEGAAQNFREYILQLRESTDRIKREAEERFKKSERYVLTGNFEQ